MDRLRRRAARDGLGARAWRLTEMSWPINVGGLPIFAWWPNLIIIFDVVITLVGAAWPRIHDLRC